jgi:hypothetical protein
MNLLLALPLTLSLAVISANAQTQPGFAWTEMTGNKAEVRAIVPAGSVCPAAIVDGHKLSLQKRALPEQPKPGFPDTCQTTLPANVKRITLNKQRLPIPHSNVKRMLIIGDTGCRVTESEDQNCTTNWPFGRFASVAAAKKPDLVVHVGDYYYRERCENGTRHCENWDDWKADFFDPAKPLFAAAPWVFARGNHETCTRASDGWFRYLDVADAPLPCPKAKEQTFLVPVGGLTLAVIDSADLPDAWTADRKLASFKEDISSAGAKSGDPLWIITHKPPFVQGYMNPATTGDAVEHDPEMPDVQMVLGGHLHLFGSFNFGPQRPAQLIVGDSGTRLMVLASNLDRKITTADPNAMLQKHAKVDGEDADFTVKGRFGYFMLERASAMSTKWTGTLYGVDDRPIATCQIEGRRIACRSVHLQ